MPAIDNSLIQGLRTLTLLARRGPLDLRALADLSGGEVERAAAVIDELQRAGLVCPTERHAFVVTPQAAALIGAAPASVH